MPAAFVKPRIDKGCGFRGQHRANVPSSAVAAALRDAPLLRGLLATAAGYFPKAAGHLRRRPAGDAHAIFIYCVKGAGWCDMAGRLQTVRAGDLLVLPPRTAHAYGAQPSNPWSLHYVHATGAHLDDYLSELHVTPVAPIVRVGEDLQLTALFNEVLTALGRGPARLNLLHAAHALGLLLTLAIRHRRDPPVAAPDATEKVGQSIVFMSEHLDQPLRVSDLAALVNVSPAHFSVLFRLATGSSPRDYLHLLRLHRACRLLCESRMSLKEIAARLGYQDPFHFSRQFKSLQGISPSRYRNQGAPPR